jgi:hypothetical protein
MENVTGGSNVPMAPPHNKQKLRLNLPKWLIVALVGVAVVSSVVLYLLFKRDLHAPPAIVVSACGDAPAGVRRMTVGYGTQIDAPEDAFVVKSWLQDMPPGRTHLVTLRNSTAYLAILPDDGSWKELKGVLPVFSRRVYARSTHSGKERVVGMDRWGYRKGGERWRYVAFSSGDAVGYLPTPLKVAGLLDQVISSACLSRAADF